MGLFKKKVEEKVVIAIDEGPLDLGVVDEDRFEAFREMYKAYNEAEDIIEDRDGIKVVIPATKFKIRVHVEFFQCCAGIAVASKLSFLDQHPETVHFYRNASKTYLKHPEGELIGTVDLLFDKITCLNEENNINFFIQVAKKLGIEQVRAAL